MKSWTSYPKIYNVGHPTVRDIFKGPVNIEEKVDGSQFSFGVDEDTGDLRLKSKGKEMVPDVPEKMFAHGVNYILEIKDNLAPGFTYRAEYLQKPKHNCLSYERVPKGHLALFDIAVGGEDYIIIHEAKERAARDLFIDVVPLLDEEVMITSSEQLQQYLDRESFLGGTKIEGIVIKPTGYDVFGKDGKPVMAKFVSERFKEKHQREWKKSNPTMGDLVQSSVAALRTEARWEKAVQRLRDAGELLGDPKDIGPLLKALEKDLREEEEEEIKERFFKWAWPKIARGVKQGMAEWYKESLMEEQFK